MLCTVSFTAPTPLAPFEPPLERFAFGLLEVLRDFALELPPDLALEPLLDLALLDLDFDGLRDFDFVDLLDEPLDDEVRDLV